MIIDFEKLPEIEVKNHFGGEGSMFNRAYMDEANAIVRGIIPRGAQAAITYMRRAVKSCMCCGGPYSSSMTTVRKESVKARFIIVLPDTITRCSTTQTRIVSSFQW